MYRHKSGHISIKFIIIFNTRLDIIKVDKILYLCTIDQFMAASF